MRKLSKHPQRLLSLTVIGLATLLALAGYAWKLIGRSALAHAGKSPAMISHSTRPSLRVAGRGNPRLSLREGRDLPAAYAGASNLVRLLEQNLGQPLALAAGDFDEDGVADLVSSYGGFGSGAVTLHRGDVDALHPHSPQAQRHRASGRLSDSPFLSPARVFAVPESPEFLGVGDFNADGHLDVVTATRGSNTIYFLPGDGRGSFGAAERFELSGKVTALVTGEINRADGVADLIVGISGSDGPEVLVFESPEGALKTRPERFALPAEATALALGRLDDDQFTDLAVAAGHELVIIKGRDRKLSLDATKQAEVRPATIARRSFPFVITSVATGEFSATQRPEVALLSDDGGVHLLGAGGQSSEGKARRTPAAARFEQWQEREIYTATISGSMAAPQLVRARVSANAADDLLVVDAGKSQLQVIMSGGERRASGAALDQAADDSAEKLPKVVSLDVASQPIAVLPMHLNADALSDLVLLQSGQSAPTVARTESAAQALVVTTTDDSGPGSLRDAITQANNTPGADTITFNIQPQGGVKTIVLSSTLPVISETVTIDGTTQPGYPGKPIIEIDGTGDHGPVTYGLNITAPNCLIKGLVINRVGIDGIDISGPSATGNMVQGCFIGINPAGDTGMPGGGDGIEINNGAHDNTIGGTSPGAGNLISGNFGDGIFIVSGGSNNNLVQGNLIGTSIFGTGAIPNGHGDGFTVVFHGVQIAFGAQGNVIGGTAAGARNIISGNVGNGVDIIAGGANNNLVQGNYIGTNSAGNGGVGNFIGVDLRGGAQNNTVGGTVPTARNIISGNAAAGVGMFDSGTTGNLVQGNYIGTDATGSFGVGNNFAGVGISDGAQNNTVGGTAAGAGNTISGSNGSEDISVGVLIIKSGTTGNVVQGNFIGTDRTGTSKPAKGATQKPSPKAANSAGVKAFSPSDSTDFFQKRLNAPAGAIPNRDAGVAIFDGAQFNLIGGTTPAARNIISGNGNDGVAISAAPNKPTPADNLVQGNYIGTNLDGTAALPNFIGVEIAKGSVRNTIGGTAPGAANLISGNSDAGVALFNTGTDYNIIQGNLIGTQKDGLNPLGNGSHGISISLSPNSTDAGAPNNNTIGPGNTIAFNNGAGVRLEIGVNNSIRQNSIFSNAGLGIDLGTLGVTANDPGDGDTGANNLQNFPTLTAASLVNGTLTGQGSLNSAASTGFTIDFYTSPACDGSGNGEGRTLLGSQAVATDGNGNVNFNFSFSSPQLPQGSVLTATATDPAGNTSEFSPCAVICIFSLSATGQTFAYTGGDGTVGVTATNGCGWGVTNNNPEFITVTGGNGGSSSGTVSYHVSNNSTPNLRIGTLIIAGITYTVTQNACTFSLSATGQSFTATAGSGSVNVTTQGGCSWGVTNNNPEFITVTGGNGGSSSGTVSYQVLANGSSNPRTGKLIIAGITYTVIQDGVNCADSISPTDASFPANVGNGTPSLTATVTVAAPAGCTWTAATNDPSIANIIGGSANVTVTNGTAMGTGPGSITYKVEVNPTGFRRVGTLSVAGRFFTVLQGATFTDVPTDSPFYTLIGKLSARGVTSGCGGGGYCPGNLVTREQMAKFIIAALNVPTPTPTTPRFADVPPSNPFYNFIDKMAVLGITSGCGGGNYCPGNPVTREQMAKFIITALNVPTPTPATPRFADVPSSNPFYNFIDKMAVLGITSGCGGGNYCPGDSVTREQMAKFLVIAFNL